MLECGLRAVVLHNKEVVWNYYAEFTADCRRINTNQKKIIVGVTTVQDVTNGIKDTYVKFKTEFDEIPYVVTSIESVTTDPEYGKLLAFCMDRTRTGFTLRVANAGNHSLTPAVNWIAISK